VAEAKRIQAASDAEREHIQAEAKVETAKITAEEDRIRAQRQIERMKEEEQYPSKRQPCESASANWKI